MMQAATQHPEPQSSSPEAVRRAVAQFLALARVANVDFSLVDGRLVMQAHHLRWETWRTVRFFLDELGVEAIESFFRTTTPEQRARLSAPAMH